MLTITGQSIASELAIGMIRFYRHKKTIINDAVAADPDIRGVPVSRYNRYRANREARGKKGGKTMHPLTWILAPFVYLYSVLKAIFGTMK